MHKDNHIWIYFQIIAAESSVRRRQIYVQRWRMIVRQRRTKKHAICDKEFIGIQESIHIDNTGFIIRKKIFRVHL